MKEKVKYVSGKPRFPYLRRHFWLYIFLLPALIYFAVFCYGPMYGILMAFQNFNPIQGIAGSEFVGLKNFRVLFQSDNFIRVFRNSLWLSGMR